MVPKFSPYVQSATVQIAGAAILSAIFCPFIVQWFAKRFGCPQYEKNFGENLKELAG
ncbi:MAG: 2-keto-3-deoxygluconate permease [Clostridium sp.]|nr:2-keto-3-deoxygluconate permease [Clostridium sp.]